MIKNNDIKKYYKLNNVKDVENMINDNYSKITTVRKFIVYDKQTLISLIQLYRRNYAYKVMILPKSYDDVYLIFRDPEEKYKIEKYKRNDINQVVSELDSTDIKEIANFIWD